MYFLPKYVLRDLLSRGEEASATELVSAKGFGIHTCWPISEYRISGHSCLPMIRVVRLEGPKVSELELYILFMGLG